MSYRLEGKDIVISGFEQGIADSPYQGIADMRNVNLVSIPGEASVNYSLSALTLPPAVNAASFTADAATDVITWTPGDLTLYKGCAIQLNTNSAGGLATGTVYYIGSISGSTFKLYTNITDALSASSAVNVSSNGSGTFTTFQLAKPTHTTIDAGETFNSSSRGVPRLATYLVDTKNQVWLLIPPGSFTGTLGLFQANTIVYAGNINSPTSGLNSICVWSGYLFLFMTNRTDIWHINISTAPASTWTSSWGGLTLTEGIVSLDAIAAQDNAIYACNGNTIASLLENAGSTFDPATPGTYTANTAALALPDGEKAACLAELGTNLMIGGTRSVIYPWDRVSTSFSYPLIVPERYISKIVSTNSNAYIFAGNRGRIYVTNGANVDLYKKIPDYVSGVVQPYYLFNGPGQASATTANGVTPYGAAIYWRNQLYFTFTSTDNDGISLTTTTALWAIDVASGAMRVVSKMSYNTYSGTIPVIVPNMATFSPGGEGLFCGWTDANGTPGIDASVSTPYTNYETYIDLDMIPVATYIDPFSPSQIEWKTSAPLVSGEAVRLSYRTNITEAFTVIGTSSTAGVFSDMMQANFQKVQWLQLRAELKSTASTPSYTRLTEIRIRDWPSGSK